MVAVCSQFRCPAMRSPVSSKPTTGEAVMASAMAASTGASVSKADAQPVVQRAFRRAGTEEVEEHLAEPLVGEHLVGGKIGREPLDLGAVLDRFGDVLREGGPWSALWQFGQRFRMAWCSVTSKASSGRS